MILNVTYYLELHIAIFFSSIEVLLKPDSKPYVNSLGLRILTQPVEFLYVYLAHNPRGCSFHNMYEYK